MSHLQITKPVEVEIEISEPIPTDAEIEADLKSLMETTAISEKDIKKLKALGVHVKRQGMLETQRGAVFVTQAWILGVTSELYRLMIAKTRKADEKDVSVSDVVRLGDLLVKLAGKQGDLSTLMMGGEAKPQNGHEPEKPVNPSFPVGTAVFGGNATAHFHQSPPPEKTVAKPPVEV